MIINFLKRFYKQITIYAVILLITVFAFYITNDSYADTTTKSFTRSELQNMIVSTAISYLRNNTYSDYDQHSMDDTSYIGSTFRWRDFTVTPEMVSRTNNFHNDCSSFVSQVVINAINYDFSEYYKYASNTSYLYKKGSYIKVNTSEADFKEGYKLVSQGLSTYYFDNFSSNVANVSAGVEYKNNSSVVNYYYEFTGDESASKRNTVIASVKERLQPGDLVVYRHGSAGHVVVYAGEFYNNNGTLMQGFIHSTGKSYDFSTGTLNRDNYAVRTGTMTSRIEDIINDSEMTSYMILRPINYYCGSSSSCNVEVNNNALARVGLTDYKIEQYVSNIDKNVSKYNSVNINEEITYNLEIKNIKSDEIDGLVITGKVPSNTSYVSCNNDCVYDKENNKITWEVTSSDNVIINTYSYTVKTLNEGVITNSGFTIKNSDNNTLQLASLDTMVNPSVNNNLNAGVLKSIIDLTDVLNKNGYLTYESSSDDYKIDITTINEDNKIIISTVNYVKFLYYNAFGIDLSTFTKSNIKSSLFTASGSVFYRKTDSKDDISKMLVPGLYGGTLLKGNDNLDRTRFMVYNDLEVGDIMVYYTSNASTIVVYIYLGLGDDGLPIFVRFSSGNEIQVITSSAATDLFNSIYTKDLFAFFRPTRVYGITINLDNGEEDDYLVLAKNGTYLNLPVLEGKYTIKFNYNASVDSTYPKEVIIDNLFDGWYKDSIKIENNNVILDNTNHTLVSKFSNKEITLPTPEVEGYEFDGWYKDSTLIEKIGDGGSNYTPVEDMDLYAKWKEKEVEKVFDITSNVFDIKEGYISLKQNDNNYTTYLEKLIYDKSFNYELKLFDIDNNLVTNNIVFTGSKLKVMDSDLVVKEFINVVFGDVNATGTVTMADVMKMVDYLLDDSVMKEEYNLKAGDVNGTNTVTMADVMKIVDYLLVGGDL